MANRSILRTALLLAALMPITPNARAEVQPRNGSDHSGPIETASGIRTDRLTKSQLKAWESIMRIVLAKDKDGRPVHPKLVALYQLAAASGRAIFLELSTQRPTMCALGLCRIEHHTEGMPKEVVLIRLNLGMIDRAIASDSTRRADGFIPFAGLGKKERYAEVLGHELAHVVQLLANPDYRHLYWQRQTLADTGSKDIQVLRSLTRLIETPAEAAEVEIWLELVGGQEPKT